MTAIPTVGVLVTGAATLPSALSDADMYSSGGEGGQFSSRPGSGRDATLRTPGCESRRLQHTQQAFLRRFGDQVPFTISFNTHLVVVATRSRVRVKRCQLPLSRFVHPAESAFSEGPYAYLAASDRSSNPASNNASF